MATSTINHNTGSSTAAPLGRQILNQAQFELLLTLRRGENVLVTLIVPVMLLIFFASLNIVPAVNGSAINFLLPGILALAGMAAGMVNLGIATAYHRHVDLDSYPGSHSGSHSGRCCYRAVQLATLRYTRAGATDAGIGNRDLCC